MAPHSSTLAWKIPWTEEPGGLQSMGSETTEQHHFHFSLSCIGGGNGNPLQCSCLENPRDGGAQWASVYGVAQSRTRLKQLSSSSSRINFKICDTNVFVLMLIWVNVFPCRKEVVMSWMFGKQKELETVTCPRELGVHSVSSLSSVWDYFVSWQCCS